MTAYTAVLISDTAVPAWHEGYREMPFVFAGSAVASAGAIGMMASPVDQAGPARRMAAIGGGMELASSTVMERRLGMVGEPYHQGRSGMLMRAAKLLTAAGSAGALLGRRSRVLSALSGAALTAGAFCTRFGIFEAGVASAKDPKYTVVPQRRRLAGS
jgi:formate-dependent nitrite reductase membrane component NrfD